ncbi:MAG: hypothetical protein QOI82_3251 [Actinomycetota bacterium]|jgi:hypothetical protein|nr:hypothetical protein [Actinomycetota bacterium]
MHALSPRRTVLAAVSAAGISLALLGAPGSTAVSAAGSPKPAQAPPPVCVDASCLNPMTEQARLAQFAGVLATRMGADSAAGLRAGINAKNALAAGPTVAGTNGTWKPLGVGPLISDDPSYTATYGSGFADLSGRITDFAYSPTTKQLWTTAAQGGVWESDDSGASWHSVGDGLPFQSVSGIAWTRAGGPKGTLMVLTGDHAFSNDYAGLGAYWTTDDGAHWNHATGLPDGALGFKIAVDPTAQSVAYAATGFGLYRTADAGRSWTNVKLPTGSCTGNSQARDCFFANIATDVEVQGADTFGHKGGAVVTTLGWRAGRYLNFDGKPQAPANGVYRSDTGAVGSFVHVADSAGITASKDFGRAALGAAHGTGQNSAYLYAVVQNSTYFTSGQDPVSSSINGDPLGVGINPLAKTSDLDGIYVSPDFGKTWRLMESGEQMKNPANGSSLNQLSPLGISAGYQVTYNEWIKPDPTRTTNGVPTRLVFGLEELWTNQLPLPLDGTGEVNTPAGRQGATQFTTIGAYNQAGACLLVAAAAACSQGRVPGDPLQTTTHPDQHGGIFIPNEGTGVTLVVGNDGGVYRQTDTTGASPFTQQGFGNGSQNGFHDLLPYGIAMAKDGTAYMGLQDNGEAKIDKDTGKQYMVYGGDGVFTVVDPDNSNIVYEEYPGARVSLSTDGGKTFTAITPSFVTDADFVTPLVMDPRNAKHVVTGGRQIAETTVGEATTGSTGWKNVYDLGVKSSPGDGGKATADDPANHVVSLAVDGPDIYAGFCGSCDPVKLHQKFHNGLATNVGGDWHIAKAKGLPQRFITSVAMDPKNHKTVYATLGASAARYFAPIGSLGEDASAAAGGYVYKSTNGGESFTNITGDLPKLQATWSLVRGGQLLVADAVGVFASAGTNGGHYAPLGKGLPTAAVFMMQLKPGDPNTLVAASFGRGGYTYRFPSGAQLPPDSTTPGGSGNGSGGHLAATGLGVGVPLTGVLLLVVVAVLRRRRTV